MAAGGAFHARGFHPTAVCGIFGAAAAAARLGGAAKPVPVDAHGVILAFLDDGAPTKPIHAGWAAHGAIMAVALASRGAAGPRSVLEGRFGFYRAFAGRDGIDLERELSDLGARWETPRTAFKAYPACHLMHGALGAVAAAAGHRKVAAEEIAEVRVRVPPSAVPIVLEPAPAKASPRTAYEAKFSLPYSAAALLVRGGLDVGTYSAAALTDEAVLGVARRVRYEAREYATAATAFPGGARLCLRDGRTLEAECLYQKGAPENPMSPDEVRGKFRANAALAMAGPALEALEAAGGDVSRYVPPYQAGEDSLFFETFNRNKRSVSLDITHPAGRTVFEDLVRVADVVYSNLRGDVPARLRIRYEDLKSLNPRIVCCSLSGFGMTGPRARDPAYDYILQGLAGWMSVTGEPGGPPAKSGLSLVDYCGGFVAAIAVLAGVHAARRDGVGMDCDLSLFDTAVSLLTYLGTWHLTGGFAPRRMPLSAHPSLVPFQNFRTADGWIVVGCAKEKFWRRLTEVLDRPALADDPRFRDFAARRESSDALLEILGQAFVRETSAHWIDRLTRAGVPCGPISSVEEALRDPQTIARGLVVATEHPRFHRVSQLASPVRVGAAPPPQRRAPTRDEDGRAILIGLLGYDCARLDALARSGAFGRPTPPAEEEPGR
jgi:crotonobetainyl-CoA:carnitine CoA-transferase CaiB-like acyl-CoA transferase